MFRKITVQRLSAGTVFKLAAIGMFGFFIPLTTVMGVLALCGVSTLTLNGQNLTGVSGLMVSPFLGAGIALFFTAFLGSILTIELWIFSRFRPLTLLIQESDSPVAQRDPQVHDPNWPGHFG